MSTRINARIDDELARQLDELGRRTGQTRTDIVEAALRAWMSERLKRPSAAEIFRSAGFVGCASGPRNLARNSKEHLFGRNTGLGSRRS